LKALLLKIKEKSHYLKGVIAKQYNRNVHDKIFELAYQKEYVKGEIYHHKKEVEYAHKNEY